MIAWTPFRLSTNDSTFEQGIPLPPEFYKELTRRGLTQAIRFEAKYIPMARAIQQTGARVIVVQGASGVGPGADEPDALHQFDAGFEVKQGAVSPCPLLLTGWHSHAMKTRALLQQFKKSGVTLDAVWLDVETQPWGSVSQWEQAQHCRRCRDLFPAGVLATPEAYRAFIGRFRQDVFSTYLAAPILEYYPKCLVANWGVVYSSAELPTPGYWANITYAPRSVGLFTALNPVAYGNDSIYNDYWRLLWPKPDATPLDQEHMDRLYTTVMLSHFSTAAANAEKWAPDKSCVPWVCRYCPGGGGPRVPALSRVRYREILRHLWLRGADSMQIFNPVHKLHPDTSLDEIADAVLIYDEMLAYREFLDHGVILNTAAPAVAEETAIWSGLRLPERAIIRAFSPGSGTADATVRPWPEGPVFTLEAPKEGATYRLSRDGTKALIPNAYTAMKIDSLGTPQGVYSPP
jgi:hypothetical protein